MGLPKFLRLGFPVVCFGLGTWQIYRLQWKKQLLTKIEECLNEEPIPIDNEKIAEYKKYRIKGRIEKNVIFIGPRSRPDFGYSYIVITPLILENGKRVLLNHGYTKSKELHIKDEIEAVVIKDIDEGKGRFYSLKNGDGKWLRKNVLELAHNLDTTPLLFRSIEPTIENVVPIPPKIEISNRHLEYIVTWYFHLFFNQRFGVGISTLLMANI